MGQVFIGILGPEFGEGMQFNFDGFVHLGVADDDVAISPLLDFRGRRRWAIHDEMNAKGSAGAASS